MNECNRAGLEQNYYYDAEGQLKSQTNFDSSTTTINYTSDRTVRTVNYSDGSQNRFVYDAIGNIVEAENSYGKTIYQYDQAMVIPSAKGFVDRAIPSEILMHELAGHAEPRIMGNIGNAIDIENSIRLELSQKNGDGKHLLRMPDESHSTH